jgi:hypothetical protein
MRTASSLDALRRAVTSRLGLESAVHALSAAAIAFALTVILLEAFARAVWVADLRTFEAAAALTALAAAAVIHARTRPRASDWRAVADRMTGEPGIFSALAEGSAPTRLTEVVRARGETAAAALLARASPRRPLPARSRQALLALLAAGMTAALPGARSPAGALDAGVQDRILADVRALGPDAPGRELLSRAEDALEARRLTAEDARRLASELGRSAGDQSAKVRAVADALESNPLLRDLAAALRKQDPAAVAAALAALTERAKASAPRSPEALEGAARLLDLASVERDEALRKALADAGHALAAGDGSGDARALGGLLPPLERLVRSARAMQDVVVSLESAAAPRGFGPGSAARAPRADRPVSGGAALDAGLPIPRDLGALARPGTSDEAVLRRYFAVP